MSDAERPAAPPIAPAIHPFEKVMDSVWRERQRQDARWGANRWLPPAIWHLILSEEVGEVAQAALDCDLDVDHETSIANLRAELVQVATVAVAWIEGLDAGRFDRRKP